MEFITPTVISPLASMFAVFSFLICVLWFTRNPRRRTGTGKQPEQPAGSWPVIGHLHLLRGPQVPHITLANLADVYGPIFMMKFGVHRVLVISNWEMAKECLATNDKVFAGRPRAIAIEVMGYNHAMFGFGPNNQYWREVRKIATVELLSNQRIEMLKQAWMVEVEDATKTLHAKRKGVSQSVLVEMKQWFGGINMNTIVKLVAGKSSKDIEHARFRKALSNFFELTGAFVVSDALPFLRFLDIGGYEKAMRKTAKELDYFLQGWLEEHKMQRSSGEVNEKKDFMDVMLDLLSSSQERFLGTHGLDITIKSTCLNLILGGTDTTTVTLTWALSLLLNNREALKKVQDELDKHIDRERQVNDSDLNNLVYLQAVIKETMRLYPPAPLAVMREAITDCTVSGYHIPAGTQLLPNLYKIHRDPRIWTDPGIFCPERFLTTHQNVDVRGQNFELIPFGSGRRMCPGGSFALQVLQYTLARLLHEFDIKTPSDEPVDMTESHGLTNLKATPLEVVLVPRSSNDHYDTSC